MKVHQSTLLDMCVLLMKQVTRLSQACGRARLLLVPVVVTATLLKQYPITLVITVRDVMQ